MDQINYDYVKKPLPASIGKTGYALTGIGLLIAILALILDSTRASFDSLIVFTFLEGIGMCSFFLVSLEYVTDAVWSVAFRRISEFLTPLIFIAPIFAIPVLINLKEVFAWAQPVVVEAHKVLQSKTSYLNAGSLLLRLVVIILVMLLFYWIIIRNSNKQDTSPDQKITKINIKYASAFMPVFAIAISIYGIDWTMTLAPEWYSTIFAVYYFTGSVIAALSIMTLLAIKLKDWDILPDFLGKDHFYNLGALIFAFTNFWAYIAFS